MSMLGGLGAALMLVLQFPLLPSAPYLKYDAGDVPVLIAAFALGPVEGVLVAALKGLLFLLVRGEPMEFIGVPMNFIAAATLAWVAGSFYQLRKTKVRAVLALVLGTLATTAIMVPANLVVLPFFFRLFYMEPPGGLLALLLSTIVPFNLLKFGITSTLLFLVYKKVAPLVKAGGEAEAGRAPLGVVRRAGRTG